MTENWQKNCGSKIPQFPHCDTALWHCAGSVVKWKIYYHPKNISSNQLFSNFFSKTLLSQNFSPKCVRLNRSSSRSKIRRFHEKNRQIEDSFAESLFWRVFFCENEFSFLRESFWRIFLHYCIVFTKNRLFWHQEIPRLILRVNHMVISTTHVGYIFLHFHGCSFLVASKY